MRPNAIFLVAALAVVCSSPCPTDADDHQHGDHSSTEHGATAKAEPPTVFLDKSPRIVAYQLKRLDNQRLLMVERKTDDAKYIPVYEAILSRPGMSPQYQEESVAALAKLRDSDAATELITAIGQLSADNSGDRRTIIGLAQMLLKQPAEVLSANAAALSQATESDGGLQRAIGYAGLMVAGKQSDAWSAASRGDDAVLDYLAAVPLLPKAPMRSKLRDRVVQLVQSDSVDVKKSAIKALSSIPADQDQTFELVAPFVSHDSTRDAAVRTLLSVPKKSRSEATSGQLVATLVKHAEDTPPKDRTTDAFIDAMQLADQLMAKIPTPDAKAYRARLREVTVRVVKIKTVEEEMRYDVAYFAVEAGSDVQIVLENHDLMPHNLVITTPGSLKEVANEGLQVGPRGGWKGLPYVPESDKVLEATTMLQPDKSERLTFRAPTEPGEYPYVCTFPQHWYRMYGVMVVVKDLDEWNKNPVEPANPIGSNRSFVQAWTVDDLKDELETGLRGRTASIGQKIFEEASCKGCHKVQGQGGVIGPELTDVFTRFKGDRVAVLREILDPSHKVDAKYQMQLILTVDGKTLSGIVLKEDDDNVTLMANPEAKEPTLVPQDDIEEMLPAKNSMMPKALMDQYTKDELFEMMGYLESVNPK
ncbi:MAG: c-type cytochrome [Pirellulaceae bacterium]|nr:c-type cytochrome [Pirellulaceae bacterium]